MNELTKIQKTKRSDKFGSFTKSIGGLFSWVKSWHFYLLLIVANIYLLIFILTRDAAIHPFMDTISVTSITWPAFINTLKMIGVQFLIILFIPLLAKLAYPDDWRWLKIYLWYFAVWGGAFLVCLGRVFVVPWSQAIAEWILIYPIFIQVPILFFGLAVLLIYFLDDGEFNF